MRIILGVSGERAYQQTRVVIQLCGHNLIGTGFYGRRDEADLRDGSGACMHPTFNLDVWPQGSDNYAQKT